MSAKNALFPITAAVVLAVSIVVALTIGQYEITLSDLYDLIGGEAKDSERAYAVKIVLEQIRLPRVLCAAAIGAALAVSGALFQGIFVNPLVSPGILGSLNGAGFGAALAMVLGFSLFGVQLFAFAFSLTAVIFAIFIAKIYGSGEKVLTLILGGVISSALFAALLSLMKYVADPYDALPSIVYWLMGSMSFATSDHLIFITPIIATAIFISLLFSKRLDLMTLGEEDAKTLGLNVHLTRLAIIALGAALAALSVMICGVIGWVGLVAPHIARFICGANHFALILASALIGALFLLYTDTLSRSLFTAEVPLGILISFVGIPVFIFALSHAKRRANA
ncbi:MAG: iron ABC transporter permease [Helicobacteraceae bacterium]|jgi:iron complex transport system permease protein|nr:iron ABC transporter permease [Helicobacteraceae bacterium]